MFSRLFFKTCLALWLAASSVVPASASTIFWGSQLGETLYTSSGQPLDGSFSFEIGTFGSFVPTFLNMNDWDANWKVIDRAYDPTPADPNDGDPEGWNIPDQFYVGTVVIDAAGLSESPDADPADVFSGTEKAYLWVFNSKANIPGTEWALLTDSVLVGNSFNEWTVPAIGDTGSYDWQLADADTAIIGGVHSVQGDGGFSANPGAFTLQTAAVPEPGSALLLVCGALLFLSRRSPSHPCYKTIP